MPEATTLQPGQRFAQGRFVLIRFLGRGGMGEVWLARDERLQEEVALKFLPSEIRGDAAALDDLRRETARSHKLTHPNIVRIHDLHEEDGGVAFIIMEYVYGMTLADLRLQQPNRVFGWDYLRPLMKQLCAALDYAHGEKVIHRDLKPANMMVDPNGKLKLADFGIAAVASDSVSRVSAKHSNSGTLPYMSPQQLTGKWPRVTDDVYALGATFYEALTSKPPFHSGDLTYQVLHEAAEAMEERLSLLQIQNPVPPAVGAMVMACLAKEPERRPQSARAVAEWIGLDGDSKPSSTGSATDDSIGSHEIADEIVQSVNPVKRTGAIVALILGFALLGIGGWYWAGRRVAPKPPSADVGTPTNPPVTAKADVPFQNPPVENRPSFAAPPARDEFIDLFNGRDLAGWNGDPRFWSVEQGAIKGQSYPGTTPEKGNTYLIWTGGTVRDFELDFSYKLVEGETGSGVLYRGRETGAWHAQGYHADFWPAGRTADGKAPRSSGNLSYEAPGGHGRRSFSSLADVGEKAVWGADGFKQIVGRTDKSADEIQATIKEGDWNDYAIVARGSHLIHKINGNVTIDVRDEDEQYRFVSGILGLKMRANKGRPMLVYFKNIRLKQLTGETGASPPPASAVSGWIPLFDGKSLSRWTTLDHGDWSVAPDGTILGQGSLSHLFSPGAYGNLEFKGEARLNHGGNSGMFFRAAFPKTRARGYPIGYEAQIANTAGDPQKTGSLWGFAKVFDQLVQDDTWFAQHIVAIGNHIVIMVNGRVVTDFLDNNYTYSSGRLALQNNGNGTVVQFRNLMVKPLPDDPSAAWTEAQKDMAEPSR